MHACTAEDSSGGKAIRNRDAQLTRDLVESTDFVWHQRFELEEGVYTPGDHDIEWLLDAAGVPHDLAGRSVLDVGTSNGGAAFLAERWGAERVVAVDIYPPTWFGFDRLAEFLGSNVEYMQGTVYDLPRLVDGRFDVVLFLGVLYHLRHPLLALDSLRSISSGVVFLETAVADSSLLGSSASSLVRFYRRDELGRDSSNWFVPTVAALHEWCLSAGYELEASRGFPEAVPERAIVRLRVAEGDPEFERLSYERSLYREDAWPAS